MALGALLPIVGSVLDKVLPDKAAREAAKLKMAELDQRGDFREAEVLLQQEQERTARHAADMSSDSWLSKNIRPLVLIFLTVCYMLIVVSDAIESWSFTVGEGHQGTLNSMLLAVYGFYFISRGIEKVTEQVQKRK